MIFVSAGHYPARPGAKHNGFDEHSEAVKWAERICEVLEERAKSVPTGILREKVGFINKLATEEDCAVEIHFNSFKVWEDLNKNGLIDDDELRAAGRGSETLYYPGSVVGKSLAEVCQNVLGKIFPPDRGVKEGWYRMNPKNGPDYFLAQTRCPAVILEPEFIHRRDEIQIRREEACVELSSVLKEYDSS